jgi:molybdopterin converting factor small subunit
MSTVKIPPVLRQAADGERTVQVQGATVAEVLSNLCDQHPAIGAQILTADGELHKFVNVYVNDEDCSGWTPPSAMTTRS